MAETLNAQWNERLWERLLQSPKSNFPEGCSGRKLSSKFRSHCGCYFSSRWGGALSFDFPTSKYRFSDSDQPLIEAVNGCNGVKITSIEASLMLPPHLAVAFADKLYEGYRITNHTETRDTFAALHCLKLLMPVLMPDEKMWIEPAESIEKEIDCYKPSRVPPAIIVEYDGKNWLRLELFLEAGTAVVRTQTKWQGYAFTPADAKFLTAGINDLHAIYANDSAEL